MIHAKYSHRFLLLISGILIILSSARWTFAYSSSSSNPKKNNYKSGGEKTTDEVFKNIKVLKGFPASQLNPTMHYFEASLGFDCSNCHVRGHNDSDKKPEKRKARKMIEMMNAINKDNFEGKQVVTCYTCHHGTPDPQKIPAVMTEAMMKEQRNGNKEDDIIKVPNRLDTPEEIISKYEQAIGGKEAFEKITSLKSEASIINANGRNYQVTILQKAPNFYYSSIKLPFGQFERGYNGTTGWMKNPRNTEELKGENLQDMKLDADFYAPIDFLKNYSGLKFSDVSVIDGDTVYVVEGKSSDIRSFKFYFDTKSGLLVRQIQFDKTLLGSLQTQTDFKDYRNVSGVLFPFELHVADYERNQDIKYSNISSNTTIDNNIFNMPAK